MSDGADLVYVLSDVLHGQLYVCKYPESGHFLSIRHLGHR